VTVLRNADRSPFSERDVAIVADLSRPLAMALRSGASCLRDGGDAVTATALVTEPARPTDLAPMLVEAYELTGCEQRVTALIARGAATAEIAQKLFLSPHTVRDRVKAVFEKMQVSSRGELVAKLFTEHYLPAPADS
jgi:DNA-binding NarL/FixJ family response regulator